MKRDSMLAALEDRASSWDVVVIGGGATGLGAAVDAASRGYRTVLCEAADFAKATSSRSTKLIHGGVRYLRQGQIGMVRQSLRERELLLRNAADIVHPLSFVIPTYRTGERWYYYAGLKAYDWLGGSRNLQPARLLTARQTSERLPTVRATGLRGGVAYSDGQFDDARLAIALARTAADLGAVILNYAPVVRLSTQAGKIAGVVVRDSESGQESELKARVVINATGVFSASVMKLDPAGGGATAPSIRPSQGTHLVLPAKFLPGQHALLIPETDDGRVLFAIPWLGHTLIGTTDVPVDHVTLDPQPLESEIDYLLEHVGRHLSMPAERSDVLSMFAGLRPLVGQAGQSTAKLSREHEIHVSPGGLISVIGGKWTTYRQMGQDLIDLAARVANLPRRASRSAEQRLVSTEQAEPSESWEGLPVSGELVERAVTLEMARTLEDVLARRSRCLFLDAAAAARVAPRVAEQMRELLGTDAAWMAEQLREFAALAETYRCG